MAIAYTAPLLVAVTGSAGSATGSGTSDTAYYGKLLGIYIDYTAQPATCDVTITQTVSGKSMTMLTVSNANTDAWVYPRQLLDDTAGADLTAVYDNIYLAGNFAVSVAQGDAGSVSVFLLYDNLVY